MVAEVATKNLPLLIATSRTKVVVSWPRGSSCRMARLASLKVGTPRARYFRTYAVVRSAVEHHIAASGTHLPPRRLA